ncbi:MocR-like transcription factor YczR [Baekduia sp. Peel2402]|uniref:MocR-like transcription factor YczR n=1 Tax=Baekduia sp. Peel2402 TaxID=3458296 RepID=UPI00403E8BE5
MSRANREVLAPALAALLGDGWRRPGEASHALADAVRALVVDGRLAARTRVPSERALSAELGISRGAVSRAYDRLREDGFLLSARGAGSWLTLPASAGGAATARVPPLPSGDDADSIRSLDLSIAALPAPDPLVAHAAERAVAVLPRHLAGHGYTAAGLPALRAAVAARLTERGLATTADEVLVTSGAQHALNLVLGLLAGPGERVLVDAPAYPRTLAAIRAARARAVPVPLGARGWDAGAWADTIRAASPRLAVTVADFHNPTGLTMSAAARETIATTCARAGTVLVVDETCAELRLDGPALPPPLGSFGPPGAVITIGTMSKSAWGGVRVGWIRATARTVRELAALRATVDMSSPVLDQLLAVELFKDWDAVVASRRSLLKSRRNALAASLAEHAPTWHVPRVHGGLSFWVRLPGPDATRLAAAAAREGLLVVPGPAFSVDGTFERHLRLPFTLPPEDLDAAVSRLAALAPASEEGQAFEAPVAEAV